LEDEFNFKGEDEEIAVPDIKAADNLKFKTLNKTKKDSDQVTLNFCPFLIASRSFQL